MEEVYEVLCDGVDEARCFRFWSINEAMKEAERVCRTFKVDVRVVRVVGTFISGIEPPKTVVERLWFTKSVRTISYWTETWCVDGTVPPDEVKHRTETTRERVVE